MLFFSGIPQELDELVQNVPLMTVGNVAVGPLLQRVLHIARTHKVRLDSNFVTMFVSIALLEGIGRQLQPDLRSVSPPSPLHPPSTPLQSSTYIFFGCLTQIMAALSVSFSLFPRVCFLLFSLSALSLPTLNINNLFGSALPHLLRNAEYR